MKTYIHVHIGSGPSELEKRGFVERDRKLLFASVDNSGAWETCWKDVGIRDAGGYRVYAVDVPDRNLTRDVEGSQGKVLVIDKKNQKKFNEDVEEWFKNEYSGEGIGGHSVFYNYMLDRRLLGVDFTSWEARHPPIVYNGRDSPAEAIFARKPGCIWLKEVCEGKRYGSSASPFKVRHSQN
jgi:hypothetical protein